MVRAGRLLVPELLETLGGLVPVGVISGRMSKEDGLEDLSVLSSVANLVLAGSASSASDLGDSGEVDTASRNLASDLTASAKVADAVANGTVADDTILSDQVEVATCEGQVRSALRSAERDGDGLDTHGSEWCTSNQRVTVRRAQVSCTKW